MNHFDHRLVEGDLARLRPARPPEQLLERLEAARCQVAKRQPAAPERAAWRLDWLPLFRWLAPATAVVIAAVALAIWRPAPLQSAPAIRADDVEIDRQLLNSYDAVATLPGGEPVRFRCREWMDAVTFRDTAGGVVIQQREPRFEVVAVRFETY